MPWVYDVKATVTLNDGFSLGSGCAEDTQQPVERDDLAVEGGLHQRAPWSSLS
jgi:hypothetical protein